jgi:hypothetical protein
MAGHAAGQGRPDNSAQAAYGAAGQGFSATGTAGSGFDPPAATMRHSAGRTADSKGFFASLFDVGFTSFVTPKVIKVLFVFAPLCTLIVLALWQITLEFFMVIFRISDDIRTVRERGEFR